MNGSIISSRPLQLRPAFSLVEMVTVLVITAMILIAAMGIYSRTRDAAADINQKLDADELPMEILQRIAEDIDRLAAPGFDTTIAIRNKIQQGYNICQLAIQNRIYDKNNRPQDFEKIIWQTYNDPLDKDLFVRLCTGITYFKVQVPIADDFADNWTSNRLPNAVTVTVSFAEPFENISGELEIYEDDMIIRTIAVDRTRMIKYKFVPKDFSEYDPNNIDETLLDSDDTSETTDKTNE